MHPCDTCNQYIHYMRSPWISSGILKSSLTKAKLLKKTLKHPTTRNIDTCTYKVLRMPKSSYYSRELLEHKLYIKKTWYLLKLAIDKHKYHNHLPNYFTYEKILSQTNMIYRINSIVFCQHWKRN